MAGEVTGPGEKPLTAVLLNEHAVKWSTKPVPGELRLHREALSQKTTNKQTKVLSY